MTYHDWVESQYDSEGDYTDRPPGWLFPEDDIVQMLEANKPWFYRLFERLGRGR